MNMASTATSSAPTGRCPAPRMTDLSLALLYGPAGTGKTSLCRALAHKLAIRYCNGRLVGRVDCAQLTMQVHERGEAGRDQLALIVLQMVQREWQARPKAVQPGARLPRRSQLSCHCHDWCDTCCELALTTDEVESIAASRAGAMSGTEPGDAVRVRPVFPPAVHD